MEIKIKDVPWNYAACTKQDCPLAEKCLRAIVWKIITDAEGNDAAKGNGNDTAKYGSKAKTTAERTLTVLNPKKATGKAGCPEYRNSEPVKYAIGFTNFREKMYPSQYAAFKALCISRFGRNSYYVRRRGERAMPPEEQSFIRYALRSAGVTDNLDFDEYDERICWGKR